MDRMSDLPIACTLDHATLKTRREGLLSEVVQLAMRREAIDNGYRRTFAASDEALKNLFSALVRIARNWAAPGAGPMCVTG